MEIDEQALDAIYCAIDEINISYRENLKSNGRPRQFCLEKM